MANRSWISNYFLPCICGSAIMLMQMSAFSQNNLNDSQPNLQPDAVARAIGNPMVGSTYRREHLRLDVNRNSFGDAVPPLRPFRDKLIDAFDLSPGNPQPSIHEQIISFYNRRSTERIITVPLHALEPWSPLIVAAGEKIGESNKPMAQLIGAGAVLFGKGVKLATDVAPSSDWNALAAETSYIFFDYLRQMRGNNPGDFNDLRKMAVDKDLVKLEDWLKNRADGLQLLSTLVSQPRSEEMTNALRKTFIAVITSLSPAQFENPPIRPDATSATVNASRERSRQTLKKISESTPEQRRMAADMQSKMLQAAIASEAMVREKSNFAWQAPRDQFRYLVSEDARVTQDRCQRMLGKGPADCLAYIGRLNHILEFEQSFQSAEVVAQGGYMLILALDRAGVDVNAKSAAQFSQVLNHTGGLATNIGMLYLSSGTNWQAWSGTFSSCIGLIGMMGGAQSKEQAQLVTMLQQVLDGQRRILERIEQLSEQIIESKNLLSSEIQSVKMVVDYLQKTQLWNETWDSACMSSMWAARKYYGLRNGLFPSFDHRGKFADAYRRQGSFDLSTCHQWLAKKLSDSAAEAGGAKAVNSLMSMQAWQGLDQRGDAVQVFRPMWELTRLTLGIDATRPDLQQPCRVRLYGYLAAAPAAFSDLDVSGLNCPGRIPTSAEIQSVQGFQNTLATSLKSPEAERPFAEEHLLYAPMVKNTAMYASFLGTMSPLWRNRPIERASGSDRQLMCPNELVLKSPPALHPWPPEEERQIMDRMVAFSSIARQQAALRSGVALAAPIADVLLRTRFGEEPAATYRVGAMRRSELRIDGRLYDYQSLYDVQDWHAEHMPRAMKAYEAELDRLGCNPTEITDGICTRDVGDQKLKSQEPNLLSLAQRISEVEQARVFAEEGSENGYKKLLVPWIRTAASEANQGQRCKPTPEALENAPYLMFACFWSNNDSFKSQGAGETISAPSPEMLQNAIRYLILLELKRSGASIKGYELMLNTNSTWIVNAVVPTLREFMFWKTDLPNQPEGWYFRVRELRGTAKYVALPSTETVRTGKIQYAHDMQLARQATAIVDWFRDGIDLGRRAQTGEDTSTWRIVNRALIENPAAGMAPWGDPPTQDSIETLNIVSPYCPSE